MSLAVIGDARHAATMAAVESEPGLRPEAALVERFRSDYAKLAPPPAPGARLALAVSGGGDSLALLLLGAAAWPGCIEAATVDHRFRAEAASEARAVAALCAQVGVPHAVLTSDKPLSGGSLQMRARDMRYALLARWCREIDAGTIATAHQCDDQAETVLMRAARGSGVAGLAGIRPRRPLAPGIDLVRPLLGWRRADLAAIVRAAGLVAAADPSNADMRHDRTRAREWLARASWLAPERLAAVAGHARDAEDAIGWAADRLWGERATAADGTVRLDVDGVPRELRRRLLGRAVCEVSNPAEPPRDDRIARLLDRLDAGLGGTIGTAIAIPGRPWRIAPAPPRRGK